MNFALQSSKIMTTKKTIFWTSTSQKKIVFITLALLSLSPFISPPIALLLGIVFAQLFEHPFSETSKKVTNWLLKASVVGLGFGMNIDSALQAGKEGFVFTITSILGTLVFGLFLGKIFKVERITSFLISGGTAICGGSAIAALSPVVKAKQNQISVALGVIFVLNSVALFIFPPIGHILQLSQKEFGLWCAISIHDTSSVVGAASKYGHEALQVATTVKLARAIWIIPLAFFSTYYFKNKESKISIPYFIGIFILAILFNSYIPSLSSVSPYIVQLSISALTLTLFLIGTTLSARMLRTVGLKPIIQGSILWIVISTCTLAAIILF